MDKQDSQDILLKTVDAQGICTLTINRPEAMNSLNGELVQALKNRFYELRFDDAVRVVIISGGEGPAFCAGADLKERRDMSESEVTRRIDDYRFTFDMIASLPKPTICVIDGYAFGGGLELALACDLRVVAADTQIGLTEVQLGIIPGAGGTQRLPRLIGIARAKELIYTGARIGGIRAAELGIANYAEHPEKLMGRARSLAEDMLMSAPIALQQAKFAIDTGMDVDLRSGLDLERAAYSVTLPTEDRLEGLEAFREKRKPKFQGK